MKIGDLFESDYEVGDKVLHKNFGEHVFTVKKVYPNIVTVIRPPELVTYTRSLRMVHDTWIFRKENIYKI